MDIKNEVLYRVYALLFGLLLPVAILLVAKTVHISIWQGDRWRIQGDQYVKYKEIEGVRGNIYAKDGSVLATSIPYFDIFFDPQTPSDELFKAEVDSLAQCLATQVDNSYTVGGYRDYLLELRADTSKRYVPIKRKVSYAEKKKIESFPIFKEGRYGGGFIAELRSERRRPFGLLAQRTIGYVRPDIDPVGLEGYFDEQLSGQPGGQYMLKVDNRRDLWMPLEDLAAIEPKAGDDVVTTIDINLQDIVETALQRAVNYHDAQWGAAVLMEVETGAIRAIANLDRIRGGWWETYNHAVGTAVEPGSTFKLASILALLEDGYVNLEDSIYIERGKTEFYEETMVDASPISFKMDSATVRQVFEISSNVGMAKMINSFYGQKNPKNKNMGAARYIERLKQFNLHIPTGIEISGEGIPYIKEAYSEEDNWSGTTLPWMAIGYETQLTPLQLLTFYNAVANDGRMMKPYLVSETRRFGQPREIYRPTVIKRQIASPKSIEKVQSLLEGVVERGTAYKLKSEQYSFAGKTGTAQINYRRLSDKYTRVGGYQASFVGYFPADEPIYSCIIVINDPNKHGIYGGDVAGPVFRELADRCFEAALELHPPINAQPEPILAESQLPGFDVGKEEDLRFVLNYLGLKNTGDPSTEMAVIRPRSDTLTLWEKTIEADKVPAVTGMGLKDAVYLLENLGLRVEVNGYGKVIQQSIKPGTRVRGQTIRLTLG